MLIKRLDFSKGMNNILKYPVVLLYNIATPISSCMCFDNKSLRTTWGTSQQTQNICIPFAQRRPNVFDVGPTLHKCYTNVLFYWVISRTHCQIIQLRNNRERPAHGDECGRHLSHGGQGLHPHHLAFHVYVQDVHQIHVDVTQCALILAGPEACGHPARTGRTHPILTAIFIPLPHLNNDNIQSKCFFN